MKVLIVRCGDGIQELQDLMVQLVGHDKLHILTPMDLMGVSDCFFQDALAFVEVPLAVSDWKQCAKRLSANKSTRVVLAYPGKFPQLNELAEQMGLQGCFFFTHGAAKDLVETVLPLLDTKKAGTPPAKHELVPA